MMKIVFILLHAAAKFGICKKVDEGVCKGSTRNGMRFIKVITATGNPGKRLRQHPVKF